MSVHRRAHHLLWVGVLALAAAGCSGDGNGRQELDTGVPDGGDGDAGGGDAGDDAFVPPAPPECDPETNAFCMEGNDIKGCGDEGFDIQPKGVQVMFMVDGSSSMENHWQLVSDALVTAVIDNPNVAFGMHLFYSGADLTGFFSDGNVCGAANNIVLDVDLTNGQNLFDTMGPRPPGVGNRWFDISPVVQALNYYVENDTALSNPDTTNYVVLVSDGNDNCFGTFLASDDDKNAAFAKISTELLKRHIRVLPVGFDAGTGMGGMFYQIQTNVEAIQTLTDYGGTGLAEALSADDPQELQEILSALGQRITPCRFSIPATLDPSKNVNGFELSFFLNGNRVPRDRANLDNWNFVDGDTSQVEFRGDACQAIRAGADLQVRRSCDEEPACGTSAATLETRTRAIQFAIDSSGSMNNSETGDCIPGNPFDTDCLSRWGAAVASITDALVLPANDDADIGLQYFPRPGEALGCEIAMTPEIPPAAGTEIDIIESLLANVPFVGFTPLVQIMEASAAAPGRLADADAQGALILLSDGQHSCPGEELTNEEVVTRLGDAAKALQEDHDVVVYAVLFGTEGDANVEAQLAAIAENGGTGTLRKAETGEALTELLSEISDELASCVIDIDLEAEDADPDKLNIYLDAELIPQDPNLEEGWYWVDEETKDAIEIYGESCTNLKQTRLSNLVVEFGCEVVTVDLL